MFLLDKLHKMGRLENAAFIVFSLMENDKYDYYKIMQQTCKKNGWKYCALGNHSKVLLFDTEKGKFVIETSSNLNENPKIEQFVFEKSEEVFDFYKSALFDNPFGRE